MKLWKVWMSKLTARKCVSLFRSELFWFVNLFNDCPIPLTHWPLWPLKIFKSYFYPSHCIMSVRQGGGVGEGCHPGSHFWMPYIISSNIFSGNYLGWLIRCLSWVCCETSLAFILVSIHILLALNLEIFIMTGGKWKRWDVVLMGTDGHRHLDLHFLFTTFGGKRSGLGWRLCSRLWLVWARSAWVKASNDETGHKINSNEVPMKGCGWKVEPGSCASWKG